MNEIETKKFDYSVLDSETAQYLKDREMSMEKTLENTAEKLGEDLFKAQQKLAKHGTGTFEDWFTSLGIKKSSAYNYIKRYSFVQQLDEPSKKEMFRSLPAKVQIEMSKTSANEEANEAVFNGDVKSHKEYKELEEKLKQKEAEAEQAKRSEQIAIENLEKEQNKEPEVVTKTVERVVVPDDYKDLERKSRDLEAKVFQMNKQLERIKEIDSYEEKAESIKQEVEYLNGERQKLKHIFDSAEKLQQLEREFNQFFDEKMAPLKYKPLINNLNNTNGVSRMKGMVNLARAWVDDMDNMLPSENRQIIEGEIIND